MIDSQMSCVPPSHTGPTSELTDGEKEIIENGDSDTATSFRHGRHHAPLVGLRVVALHRRDGIAAAPPAHREQYLAATHGFPRSRSRTCRNERKLALRNATVEILCSSNQH